MLPHCPVRFVAPVTPGTLTPWLRSNSRAGRILYMPRKVASVFPFLPPLAQDLPLRKRKGDNGIPQFLAAAIFKVMYHSAFHENKRKCLVQVQ